MTIRAITFDLWDTIIHDESDEPKRATRGLRSKKDERRYLVWEALNRVEPISQELVALAYDVTDAAFNHVWHDQHVTWSVRERLTVLLAGLRRTLPGGALAELVRTHEEMEITVAPDPIAGMPEVVRTLAARYPLAVVSDAIVSPGRCLRRWLELHDLLRCFSGFSFSDEVGCSKPARAMFAAAAQQLGVELCDIVHVGDRDHNDVKGAQAAGMKAILFHAVRDRDRASTSADALCGSAAELPQTIERLG